MRITQVIDPMTALAMANAAFRGVKRAVELGREASDIYQQLGTWAGHVSDLNEYINGKPKKPKLFEKITFAKSETAEAFDEFAVKTKIAEMEKEIYHEFLYGGLQHLGMDGYHDFIRMRREIKAKRERMIYQQLRRRREFIHTVQMTGAVMLLVATIGVFTWLMVMIISS